MNSGKTAGGEQSLTVRAVLFDLDGTLIDTIPLIRWTFERVFADFGLPWENGEVLHTVGLPLREIAARYMPDRADEFMERYAAFQKTRFRELTRAYPGAVETLATIKSAGYRTGVVTSKRREPALASLALTGLDQHIEAVVTADDVTKPKPDPEPVFKALELLHTRPQNAAYIGDSWYDVVAGKQAGVTTVGATWGIASREQLAEHAPDIIVDSWDEFLANL
ncbi:HAD family hydrolase [Candidatus Desulforudis audaxviator]|nr:HAD family hydrolase [Candidatus Desulforudis audaxviator]